MICSLRKALLFAASFLATALLLLPGPGNDPLPAAAATQTLSVVPSTVLRPGDLSLDSAGSLEFDAVLDGRSHQVAAFAAPSVVVTDARGSGAGWTVTMTASGVSGPDGATSQNLLNGLQFVGSGDASHVTVMGASGAGRSAPPIEPAGSQPLTGRAVVISSSANRGMGRYRWTPAPTNFLLQVPEAAHAGVYQATLMLTVSAAP